jgi:RNA polymerase sigma-70 factor (ECF subfamily)
MVARNTDTSELLRIAAQGDRSAIRRLLEDHRGRLRQMVAIHLDRRMAARVDPSDVVQESLVEAARRLPGYLENQSIPFYPWLRQIAWQKLLDLRDHHIAAQKRSVNREDPLGLELTDESVADLAERFIAGGSSPSQGLLRQEQRERVRLGLALLKPQDREVLVLRYLEQLAVSEVTAVLGITEDAFIKRHWRAVQRLRSILSRQEGGGEV